MNFIQFKNQAEMQAYLIQAQADADAAIHPAQRAVTFGDHWAQFVDIANRIVVFGHTLTLTEVKFTEMYAGATLAEAKAAVRETNEAMANNFLYGRAYSILCPEGEYGNTHKSVVWPIEESLYNAAHEVNWNIDLLPTSAKINLQAAFTAYRGRAA